MEVEWLASWTLHRAVWVRALAGVISLCSWSRHFTLSPPWSINGYWSIIVWATWQNAGRLDLQWTNIHAASPSGYPESRVGSVSKTGRAQSGWAGNELEAHEPGHLSLHPWFHGLIHHFLFTLFGTSTGDEAAIQGGVAILLVVPCQI